MSAFGRPVHAGFMLLAFSAMCISGCGHHAARINAPVAPARIGSTESGVASWYGIPYDGRRAASGEIYDMRQLTAAHRRLPFQTWVEVTNLANGKQVDVRINDRGPFVKGRILDLSQAAASDIDMLRAGTARVRLKVIPPPDTLLELHLRERVEITAASVVAPTAVAPPVVAPTVVAPTVIAPPFAEAAPPATVPPVRAATPAAAPALVPLSRIAPPVSYVVQAGAFSDPARAESLRAILEDVFAEARVVSSNGRTPPLWRVIVGREMTRERAAGLAIRVRRETGTAIVVPEPGSNSTQNSPPKN